MTGSAVKPLCGVTVLVTRPGEQGVDLVNKVEAAGGTAVYVPLIEIELLPDSGQVRKSLDALEHTSILVFVSVHAVRSFVSAIEKWFLEVPDTVSIAAVGAATARALRDSNLKVDFVPVDEMSSEGLLALLEQTDLDGTTIQIYRGQSGRTLLTETFRARGATVNEIESYRRARTGGDISKKLIEFASAETRIITLTSVEFVQALADSLQHPQVQPVAASALAVLSERIAEAAVAAGFAGETAVASTTSNAGLVAAIEELLSLRSE